MASKSKNSQVKKTSHNGRKAFSAVIILVILGVCALIYINHHNRTSKNVSSSAKIDNKPAPAADNKANNTRKSSPSPSTTLDSGSSTISPGSATSNQAPAPDFSVEIVNSSVESGNLHVGTMVSGTKSGTCTLTATKAGQSSLQLATSSVTQDVNAYDCGAYNIPTSKFTSNGTWNIILTVQSDGATNSATQSVDI
jgi:hypothetical protein